MNDIRKGQGQKGVTHGIQGVCKKLLLNPQMMMKSKTIQKIHTFYPIPGNMCNLRIFLVLKCIHYFYLNLKVI